MRLRDLLLVAVALAANARIGRAEGTSPPPVAKADHVEMVVAGKPLAGWPIDMEGPNGAILLGDDGVFVTIAKDRAAKIVATAARPVTEIPGLALVDGLSRKEESVRDRCQELLALRGAEAEPLLALALVADSAEPRRRALDILVRTPIVTLGSRIRARISDEDERVRSTALEAYARLKRDDTLRILVDSLLTDRAPLVQHSAAQQVGRLGDLRGVDPLLERLASSEDRGVRIASFAALRTLTGKGFGRDEAAWRAWWTNHRDEYLPEEGR
jgi:hypothetical protein